MTEQEKKRSKLIAVILFPITLIRALGVFLANLPKKMQRNPILAITLIGTLGAFLGNLSNFKDFYQTFFLQNNRESAYYGIWYGTLSYPITDGTISMTGTTEYFKTNAYNYIAKAEITISNPEIKLTAYYDIIATGKWQGVKQHFKVYHPSALQNVPPLEDCCHRLVVFADQCKTTDSVLFPLAGE